MVEFIFFNADLRDRFATQVQLNGGKPEVRDDHFGWVLSFEEQYLNEEVMRRLEAEYEELEFEQMHLIEQEEDGGGIEKHVAGFDVRLSNGNTVMAPIQPDLAGRLMAEFTFEEIHTMFSSVAEAAINPDDRPLCKR